MYNQSYRTSQVLFERTDSVSFRKYGAYVLRIGMHFIAEGARMKTGRPKSALVLTAERMVQLQSWVTARWIPPYRDACAG